jgi:tetratricopeptide (TPR) repeat protein
MKKQLLTIACVSLCFSSMSFSAVIAQNNDGPELRGKRESREGGKGQGRREGDNGRNQGASAATQGRSAFPGMGSFDAWKSSLPEFRAGQKCMKDKQWDQAIAHFKASVDLYEYQPRAWLQVGRALQRKGADVAEQEKCFRKALKLDQSNWHSWKELANVLFITKRYGEARESLASAIQLNPPPEGKLELEKMIKDVDSAQRNSDTGGLNTGQ